MQLSAGQCVCAITFLFSLLNMTTMSSSICFLRMLPIFRTSTGSSLIERMVSHDMSPICCPSNPSDTLSMFAGLETSSPLMNPS